MISLYVITAWLSSITAFLIGLFVYFKNPRGDINRRWSFFNLSIALWSLFLGLMFKSVDAKSGLKYSQILMVGADLIPVPFYHFVLALLGQQKGKTARKILILGYSLTLFLLAINFTPLFIKSASYKTLVRCFYPDAGPLFLLYVFIYFCFPGYSFFLMHQATKSLFGIRRNQVRYVMVASIVGFLGGATTFPLWYNIPIPPFGSHFVWLYTVIITIAIIKHRLMDIRVAVSRLTIFLLVYTFVLGIPFFLGYKYGLWMYSTCLMFILATSGPFIYRYLQKKAENLILAKQRHYQKILLQASEGMVREHNLNRLLKLMVRLVKITVGTKFTALFFHNKKDKLYLLKEARDYKTISKKASIKEEDPIISYLRKKDTPFLSSEMPYRLRQALKNKLKANFDLVIPSSVEKELLGFLLLEEKKDNSVYTQDDINIFKIQITTKARGVYKSRLVKRVE